MKKAQIELIGILLITIFIIFGFLFYLKFTTITSQPQPSTTTRTTQATNLLIALPHLPLCHDKTIQQALATCAETPDEPFCDDQPSCTALQTTLPIILDPILHTSLGLNYSLTATLSNTPDPFFSLPGCTTGTATTTLFEEHGNTYELMLRICKD